MKMYFRICGALICLCLLAGCTQTFGQTELRSDQRRLLEHAYWVQQVSAEMSEAWPGFWQADNEFLLYYRSGSALLVSNQLPAPGYEQLRPGMYYYAEGLPQLTDAFRVDYQVEGRPLIATSMQATPASTVDLLFHEAFHGYQRQQFQQRARLHFVADTYFASPEARALLQLRRTLLAQSLDYNSADQGPLLALLRDFVSVDRALRDTLSEHAYQRLEQLEVIEGSAQYIGVLAASLAFEQPTVILKSIALSLERPVHGVHSVQDLRAYAYGTGAALTRLLTLIDSNFQATVESTYSLTDALAAHIQYRSVDEVELARLLERLQFAQVVQWAETDKSGMSQITLEEFAAISEHTLKFTIAMSSAQQAADLSINFSTGDGGFSQPEEGSYLLPNPLSVSVHNADTSLLIKSLPTRLIAPNEHSASLRLEVKVDSLPDLCGEAAYCELDSLRLHVEGIDFQHERAARIERDNHKSLHITLH